MPTRPDDRELVDLFMAFVDRRRRQGYDEPHAVAEASIDMVTTYGGDPAERVAVSAGVGVLLLRRLRVVLEERDRARQIAVDLEQELAHVDELLGVHADEQERGAWSLASEAWRELADRRTAAVR